MSKKYIIIIVIIIILFIGLAIAKNKQNLPLTETDQLRPLKKYYWKNMLGEQLLRISTIAKCARSIIEPNLLNPKIVSKNYEMSYDAKELSPLFKDISTSVLQEYFIPISKTNEFAKYFWKIINKYNVNLINFSIRFVKKTNIPILNYAPNDRVAFVLYYNLYNNNWSISNAKIWTQLLINRAINLRSSYYLPYLPFAEICQFQSAYPEYKKYIKIKQKYDPKNKFTNQFIKTYLMDY